MKNANDVARQRADGAQDATADRNEMKGGEVPMLMKPQAQSLM